MSKVKPKRSLGRGLTALIPESDIDFLKSVARGEAQPAPVRPTAKAQPATDTAKSKTQLTQPNQGASHGPTATSAAPETAPNPGAKNGGGTNSKGTAKTPAKAVAGPGKPPAHQPSTTDISPDAAASPVVNQGNHTPATTGATNIARGEAKPNNSQSADPSATDETASEDNNAGTPTQAGIRHITITSVQPNPFQPRQIFDENELEDLANSIREHGVLQPILVRPIPEEARTESNRHLEYQLIAGERRWRACTRAGLAEVPAIIRVVSDLEALELALIENVQRHDIGPIESAEAYRRLATEFQLSQEEISKRVGKSRAAVANTMRLLDLPAEAVNALKEGKITEGHGRALLTAAGDGARRALLRRVLRDELSVREVERLAREAVDPAAKIPVSAPLRTPDLERLERTLQKALGTRLKLKPRRRGGQIVIDFFSPEDLQRLVGHLTGLKPLRPASDANRPTSNAVTQPTADEDTD